MTSTFESSASFHASHSLLGQAFRAWTEDRLKGEALYLVALTGGALVLLMSHYLGWALLKPVLANSPSSQVLFWGGQLASVLLWAGIGFIGFRPAMTVKCRSDGIEVEQGDRARSIAYDEILTLTTIPATRYHRHYRHYEATTIFVTQFADEVLLLRTPSGPVVIGLPDADDLTALQAHIEAREVNVPEPVPQPQS